MIEIKSDTAGEMIIEFIKALGVTPSAQLTIGNPNHFRNTNCDGKLFHYSPESGAIPFSFDTPEELHQYLQGQFKKRRLEGLLHQAIEGTTFAGESRQELKEAVSKILDKELN